MNSAVEKVGNPFANHQVAERHKADALVEVESQRAAQEVQASIALAKRFPRDPIVAADRVLNAFTRPSLAEVAVYQYSRGGSDIMGPSIRSAEAIAQLWGNMSFGIRELDQRAGESTVQAFAWDFENNTKREMTFQVPHARYTRSGGLKKLSDPRDIYEMVANQGARRLRACILSIVPGDIVEAAMNQADVTMRAKADTSPDAMKKMVEAFASFGVSKAQIEKRIQRKIESIQPAQVVGLRKIHNSLRDGMSEAADWFELTAETDKPTAADKKDAAKQRGEDAKQAAKEAAASLEKGASTEGTSTRSTEAPTQAEDPGFSME